jgi:threonine dehydrogenase-like Zn-dependent dehydrogenase
MGHEGNGVIEEVGEGVTGFEKGQPVTALCGSYSRYFNAGPGQIVPLPANVDPLWAMGEPISCCVHALERSRIRKGERAMVIGAGFMGQVCAQLARCFGAGWVGVLDTIPWRLPPARELGADWVGNPDGISAAEMIEAHGEFDHVIEVAGVAPALDLATELVREHGCINIVSTHQTDNGLRTIDMYRWNWKSITVINGHVRRVDEKLEALKTSVRLVGEGKVNVRPLITHYPLADVEQAFRDLVNRKEGLFKAALLMEDRPA